MKDVMIEYSNMKIDLYKANQEIKVLNETIMKLKKEQEKMVKVDSKIFTIGMDYIYINDSCKEKLLNMAKED